MSFYEASSAYLNKPGKSQYEPVTELKRKKEFFFFAATATNFVPLIIFFERSGYPALY